MDHEVPQLSVVLCTYNGAATIAEQLDALSRQDTAISWELIVVDNSSTDGSAQLVCDRWTVATPMKIVTATERMGVSYARNRGVEAAAAEQIAFCDDDDVVDARWVEEMAAALSDHQLVAPAFEYDRLNTADQLIGRAGFQSVGIEELLGLPVCSGACGVTRSLWQELGGNDEAMDATGEDFDFALRARRDAAVTPYFAPMAIYHCRLRSLDRETFGQALAFGRSHATLWAKYGDRRISPRDDVRRAAGEWWWILTRAPLAALGRNRLTWARAAGRRVGRLDGSLAERVFVP